LGFFMPYVPSDSSRAGYPWAPVSSYPFIPNAMRVRSSMAVSMGRLSEYPSADRNTTSTARGSTPARSRISGSGIPSQRALEMSWPPTGLLMHSSVWNRSTAGSRSRSAKERPSGRRTRPLTESRHVEASRRGSMIASSTT